MTTGPARAPADLWSDALRAAAALAVDPAGLGGAVLRAPPGEPRAAWLAHLGACLAAVGPSPWVQIPADVSDQQLLGGLDLAATLAAGRPVSQSGALARAGGGVLLTAMAERLQPAAAAVIAAAMDGGPAPFAVVALDEGATPDERPPAALVERLALHLDLGLLSHRDVATAPAPDIPAARAALARVRTPEGAAEALCAAADALGVTSDRAPLFALRLARALAALDGEAEVGETHLVAAARLALGPRAARLPAPPAEADEAAQPPPPPEAAEGAAASGDPDQARALEDRVLEAAAAAIPPDLLDMIRMNARRGGRGGAGKAGEALKGASRGRPIASRKGELRSRARLDLLDTLRAAAPWQRLRGREPGGPIRLRPEDVRVKRFRDRQASTTIFVVDASGSAALDRLAEAKGAVELMLAECYVRRDEVGLVAFRGSGAEILLPATRSLNRAKRALAALPGGGGTPLAAGLVAAERMADDARRKGRTPTLVVITDGRANVCRDGSGGRQQAHAEAEAAAAMIRTQGRRAILIDNAPRPDPKARAIAERMGAAYLPLPHVQAAALAEAVKAVSTAGGRP